MTPEELQAAAQGAARAYKARFVDPGAEWEDLLQEAALALLSNKQRMAQADNPQAMAFVIAFRAIRTMRGNPRELPIKPSAVVPTPEELSMHRQMLRITQQIIERTRLTRKSAALAVFLGEKVASVTKRERIASGMVYNKVWRLRCALAKDPRVQEWRR